MKRVGKILTIIAAVAIAVAIFVTGAGACPGANIDPCTEYKVAPAPTN